MPADKTEVKAQPPGCAFVLLFLTEDAVFKPAAIEAVVAAPVFGDAFLFDVGSEVGAAFLENEVAAEPAGLVLLHYLPDTVVIFLVNDDGKFVIYQRDFRFLFEINLFVRV